MIREFMKGNNKTDAGVKENTPALKKQYEVIYADPPWRFRVRTEKGKGRSAENHYPTMKLEDICKLPVKEIAADDSILFMWATFPNLKETFDVIDAWGFDYKTVAFVWVKQNKKSDSLFWGMPFMVAPSCSDSNFPPFAFAIASSLSFVLLLSAIFLPPK